MMIFNVAAAIPFSSNAQLNVGIGVGISNNRIISNPTFGKFTSYQSSNGFATGVILRYDIHKFISIGLEPSYLSKQYKIARNNYYQGVYQEFSNHYVQLPLLVSFSITNKKIRATASVGGYAAYWANSKQKGVVPNLSDLSLQADNFTNVFQNMQPFAYNVSYKFDTQRDNRWELGWASGADLQYSFDRRLSCFIAARYYYSLTNQEKQQGIYQYQQFNETLVVTMGLSLKTNFLKKGKQNR